MCEGEGHKMEVFPVHMQAIIFANSLKEYEIITLQEARSLKKILLNTNS